MASTAEQQLASPDDAARLAKAETVLTPRFYTTDYAAMDRLDVGGIRREWDVMMAEYEGDNNHDHFQRTAEFSKEVAEASAQWTPQLRRDFQEFLVSSLTSEYSGCVLWPVSSPYSAPASVDASLWSDPPSSCAMSSLDFGARRS